MDIKSFNQIITSRRSVFPKDYEAGKIDDQIIWQILKNANWAPTHKMTAPWRFKVYSGKGLEFLGKKQAEIYKKVSLEEGNFVQSKFDNLTKTPLQASHVIMIIMKRCREIKIREVEEIAAVSCAVQNMYLTTTVYGLGAYWNTGGITYMESAKQAFNINEKDRLMGFFYLGKKKSTYLKGKRKPIEDSVEWIDNYKTKF